jgi:hypothetical protein
MIENFDFVKDMYEKNQRLKLVDLKIQDETFSKHLEFCKEFISVTCDNNNGDIGDIVLMNQSVYTIMNINLVNIDWLMTVDNNFWILNGSKSKEEYISELKRLYGNDMSKPLYVYALRIIEWRNK